MVSVILAVWACVAWAAPNGVRAQSGDAMSAADPQEQSVGEAIDLDAGPTCLEEQRLERRVARWLGRQVVDPGVRIWVRGGPSENRVQFTLRRTAAERTQRDLGEVPGDCGDRHAAVALAIALAIDAGQLGSLGGAEPEGEPVPTRTKSKLYMPEVAGEAWSVTGALSAAGGAGVGLLTAIAPAISVGVHVGVHPQLELRLSGRWSGLRGQQVPDVDVRYDVHMLVGGVALCPVVRGGAFELAACGELLGGVFTTSSEGLLSAGTVSSEYWAASLGLDFRLHISGAFLLHAGMDLVLPFASRRLVVYDAYGSSPEAVTNLRPAALVFGVGPMVRFF